MGVTKYLQGKIKEKVQNYQAERTHQKEERLEQRTQYEKGRREGSYERGKIEGSGRVTEQTKYADRGGRKAQGVTGSTRGFSGAMKHSDDIFGWSGSTGGGSGMGGGVFGSGLSFGGGSGGERSRPDRVITKRNGGVRIEEYGSRHESEDGMGGLGLGMGLGIDSFGGSEKGKKKEKHPYDFF